MSWTQTKVKFHLPLHKIGLKFPNAVIIVFSHWILCKFTWEPKQYFHSVIYRYCFFLTEFGANKSHAVSPLRRQKEPVANPQGRGRGIVLLNFRNRGIGWGAEKLRCQDNTARERANPTPRSSLPPDLDLPNGNAFDFNVISDLRAFTISQTWPARSAFFESFP